VVPSAKRRITTAGWVEAGELKHDGRPLTARQRRDYLRRGRLVSPCDDDLVATVTAAIELAVAFFDSDPNRRRRLIDYVAGCVVEDLQDKYNLSLIGDRPEVFLPIHAQPEPEPVPAKEIDPMTMPRPARPWR
jgi:hypothetical protein